MRAARWWTKPPHSGGPQRAADGASLDAHSRTLRRFAAMDPSPRNRIAPHNARHSTGNYPALRRNVHREFRPHGSGEPIFGVPFAYTAELS